MERHRNVEPPTFNEQRLNEMPIPELLNNDKSNNVPDDADQSNTSQENETVDDNLPLNGSSDQRNANQNSTSHEIETVGDNLPLDDSSNQRDDTNQTDPGQNKYFGLFDNPHEDEISHSEDGNDNDESDPLYIDTAQFEIKQEHLDLIENHAGNSDDIDQLLQDESTEAVHTETESVTNENGTNVTGIDVNETGVTESATSEQLVEEMVHDDVFIIIGKSGIPKPKGMRFKLVKRENDPFSGNIPFDDTVSIQSRFKSV